MVVIMILRRLLRILTMILVSLAHIRTIDLTENALSILDMLLLLGVILGMILAIVLSWIFHTII